MIKWLKFTARHANLSVEEFRERWESEYSSIIAKDPDLAALVRRYVHNDTARETYESANPAFDAVEELWFDKREAFQSFIQHESYQSIGKNVEDVVSDTLSGLVYEVPIDLNHVDGGMIKGFGILYRKDGMSISDFHHYWKDSHGETVTSAPSWDQYVRHYVQNHAINEVDAEHDVPFDGVAECWYDSLQDLSEWETHPDWEETFVPDEKKFQNRDAMIPVMTREHPVL